MNQINKQKITTQIAFSGLNAIYIGNSKQSGFFYDGVAAEYNAFSITFTRITSNKDPYISELELADFSKMNDLQFDFDFSQADVEVFTDIAVRVEDDNNMI